MDLPQILSQLDHERRHLVRSGEVADVLPDVVRLGGSDGSWHSIAWSSLTAETADAAIEREISHHRAIGADFEWKLYGHDGPSDLLDRLRRRGFEIDPVEAVMVYDLVADGPLPVDSEHRVVRVDDLTQLAVYRHVAEAVFGKDYSFTAAQLADAIATGSTEHRGYVIYSVDGIPAGVGRLYTHARSQFAGLYGGGTLAAYRGKGVYRAGVAARARDAIAAGVRYLQVDALPTSRPILERLGFVKLTETWPCQWKADA